MTMIGNGAYESVIKLELLQVHNWGLFQHPDPISLNDNNLFFGDNGSGKTMSMDGLTYLLYGNNRFNISSEKKGGDGKPRNVLAMILGTINSEEQINLRPVGTISYILVQGYDKAEHSHFVLGVCLESVDTDRYNAYRFVLKDTKLNQVYYCERGADDTIKMLRHNEIKVIDPDNPLWQGEKIQFYQDTSTGVRQFMSVLGMAKTNSKQIVNKINQVLSYDIKSDLDKFLRENILTESSMIAALNQIRDEQMKHSEQLALLGVLVEKRDMIGEILNLNSNWIKAKRKYILVDLCNLYSAYMHAAAEESKKIEEQKKEMQIKQTEIENEKYAKKQETDASNELRRAESALSQDEKERKADIENQLATVNEELEKSISRVNKLIEMAQRILCVLNSFQDDDPRIQKAISSFSKIGAGMLTSAEIHDCFAIFNEWKEKMMESVYKEKMSLSSKVESYKSDIRDMSSRLEAMKTSNSMDYPPNYIEAKRVVTEEMKKNGISESESHIRFFAETVESIDPEWQRAIEIYLGDRRYHLIVPDKYNMLAYDIIRKKHLYNVDVPYDSKSGNKVPTAMNGSAAQMLAISNHEARVYADYVLGRVKLCKDDAEMKQALNEGYIGAITKEGDVARGRSRHLNDIGSKKIRLFIGAEAVKKAIEDLERDIRDLTELASIEESKMKRASIEYDSLRLIPSVTSEEYDFNAEQYMAQYTAMRDRYISALKQFQQDNASVFEMIEEARIRHERCLDEYRRITARISVAQSNIERLEKEIRECHNKTKEAFDAFSEKEASISLPNISDEVKAWYEKALQKNEYPLRDKDKASANMTKCEGDLREKQTAFKFRFGLADVDLVGTDAIHTYYRRVYDELDKTDIERAKNDIRTIEENVTHSFCSNFIVQIHNLIQRAKADIHEINRFMASRQFGSQTYKIECHERTDDNFGTFMNLIEALDIHYGMDSADESHMDENAKENLLHFMNFILEDQNIMLYADYRNYLKTDVCIEEMLKDGKSRHFKLSKKNATASNGEKATPFLIIMVLSMYSILKDNKYGYRSFFMDEAFSVYSADRIKQMMQLLKDLGFQGFFAGPDSSKAKYMENVALINTYKPEGATFSVYIDSIEKKIV